MIRSWIQYIPSWITALWAWKPFLEIDYICQIQQRQVHSKTNSPWYPGGIYSLLWKSSPHLRHTLPIGWPLWSLEKYPQDFPVMGLFGSTEYHAEKHRTLIRAQKPEKRQKKTGDTKSAPNEQLTHWSMRFSWDSYYMFVNQWSNDQWFYPLVN